MLFLINGKSHFKFNILNFNNFLKMLILNIKSIVKCLKAFGVYASEEVQQNYATPLLYYKLWNMLV